MDIKLIAIDLDGTLLTSKKEICAGAEEMLAEARQKKNVQVVLATARPPRTTMPYYHKLGLRTPMINYDGALVWEPTTGQVLMHEAIPLNISQDIIKWARGKFPGIHFSAKVGDRWYTDFHSSGSANPNAPQPDIVAPVIEWMDKPLTRLQVLGKAEWVTAVSDIIRKGLSDKVSTVLAQGRLLQIMNKNVAKHHALSLLSKRMGIPREQIMAIGDNLNDASMIKWAGVGVAMANGHFISLRLANHHTDHHDYVGVGNAVRDLILHGLPPVKVS